MNALASSHKFRTFALVFAITSTVLYVMCDMFGWPLFTFHPGTNRVDLGWAGPRLNEGPVMYWYGWTATTMICATVVGFLATLLPENSTKNIPLLLIWVLPILAVPILVYSLMPFWTK